MHGALARRLAHLPTDVAVLDVGCGTGAWLDRLGRGGFTNLHGIDLDVEQFGSARATASRANLDYDDLGLGALTFDLITAIEIVEHLENPGRLFIHVAKHLKADGLFVMTTPNIHSVLARLRFFLTGDLKQFDRHSDPTHIYPVLLAALERVLPRHGLRIVERWSYPEDGSSPTSRGVTRALAAAARLFIKDNLPGDIMVLTIRKQSFA